MQRPIIRCRRVSGLHVSSKGDAGVRFYHEEALRTLRHNRRLREEILAKAEPAAFTTESGIVHGWGFRVLWDSDAHDAIVERTIRGLYYHYFGEVLGKQAKITI